MNFTKMQAAGNDFVLINSFEEKLGDYSNLAEKLCHRKYGIGADGILIPEKSEIGDIKMVYFNSDGSQSAMCGNGIRCFSKYIYENKLVEKKSFSVETGDGLKYIQLTVDKENVVTKVKVDMGEGTLDPKKLPVALDKNEIINEKINIKGKEYTFSTILTGVIHTVIFVDTFDNLDINGVGREIEIHPLFPEKTNVNFVKIIDKNNVEIRTWERGAGRTLACGTGSCGTVALGNYLNLLDNDVNVHTEGGVLNISMKGKRIYMEGSATTVFKGVI